MNFKSLAAVICGVLILSSSLCFAAVDSNKIALGGISPGMSETSLIDAFGQPKVKDGEDWTYPTFRVEVKNGIVKKISTSNETIITPDGIRVGLKAEALNSTFGKADDVDHERNGEEYEYYSTDQTKEIEFKVTNGIITKITCKLKN